MIGKLLSTVTKIATLPVDVAEVTLDVVTGGDGSRQQMKDANMPMLSELRDGICEVMEDIDK